MKKNFNFIGYAIVYLFAFAIMGILNLVRLNWDFGQLATVEYWIETGATSLLYLLIYINSISLAIDTKMIADDGYVTSEKGIQAQKHHLLTEDFSNEIVDINYDNKLTTWKEHWHAKRTALLDRRSFKTTKELRQLENGKITFDALSRKARRWKRKYDYATEMISEEWIKENLDFIRFTYPKITQQEVISGSHKAMSKSSMLDKGYRTKAVFSRIGNILMMTALTAIALSAVFEQGSVTQAMMFSLVIQVGMGFFNMFNGYRTGVKVFQESVVGNQIVRMGIVFKYLRKKKINTSVDKEKEEK